MANGGRKYVSKEELSIIESIKHEKKQILDLERKELQNIKALKQAYADTGDESLKLTAAMKQRLNEHEREELPNLPRTSPLAYNQQIFLLLVQLFLKISLMIKIPHLINQKYSQSLFLKYIKYVHMN